MCICVCVCIYMLSTRESIEEKGQPFLMKIFEMNLKKQTHLCTCVNTSTCIFRYVYIYITWRLYIYNPVYIHTHFSILEGRSPMDRRAWWAAARGSQRVGHNWVTTHSTYIHKGLPLWLTGKKSICQCSKHGFQPWAGKIPWRREWLPTPVFSPGEFHGQRSLPEPLNINNKYIHNHWTLFLENVSFEWKGDNIWSSLWRLFWPHYVR